MLTTKKIALLFSSIYICHTITAANADQAETKSQFKIPEKGASCVLPPFKTSMPNDLCMILREMAAETIKSNTVLIYGPRGNGKTTIAKAMGHLSDSEIIFIKSSDLISKWAGGASAEINEIFQRGEKIHQENMKRVIYVFDEIDAIAKKISIQSQAANSQESNATQSLWQNIDQIKDNPNFYVIGITNDPDRIDDTFIRRFNHLVYIPKPSLKDRRIIFTHILEQKKYTLLGSQSNDDIFSPETIEKFAQKTEGFGASYIEAVIIQAIRIFNDQVNPTIFSESFIFDQIEKLKKEALRDYKKEETKGEESKAIKLLKAGSILVAEVTLRVVTEIAVKAILAKYGFTVDKTAQVNTKPAPSAANGTPDDLN